jgi:hypothetical protein
MCDTYNAISHDKTPVSLHYSFPKNFFSAKYVWMLSVVPYCYYYYYYYYYY